MSKITGQISNIFSHKGASKGFLYIGSFILTSTRKVSISILNSNGILVRTLVANKEYNAGTYPIYWDGKDDFGNILAAGNYQAKVTSHNLNISWQGVVGNTSLNKTGTTIHKGYYTHMSDLVFTNGYGYYCSEYTEQTKPPVYKFAISSPQVRYYLYPDSNPVSHREITSVCTNGTNVFWGAFDVDTGNSFIFATKVSDDSEVAFSSGSSIGGYTYGIDITTNRLNDIAVQQSGNFLFVAHAANNELHVINATTGALLQTISVTNPRRLSIDTDDNLWMISGTNLVAKYSISGTGNITSTLVTITNTTNPTSIKVGNGNIYITDTATNQLLTFNSSGTLIHTKGGESYITDTTVSNNKFYFTPINHGKDFIAIAPNGDLWINDAGNYRVQHYDSSYAFIDRIMSLPASYYISVDKNNTNTLFSGFLEFSLDTTVSLSGTSGWSLVRNWLRQIPSTGYYIETGIENVTTITYGGISKKFGYVTKINTDTSHSLELVEFKSDNTLRFTGILLNNGFLMSSGDLFFNNLKYTLTGFDGSNNPMWSNVGLVITTAPSSDPDDIYQTPIDDFITTSGKAIFYNTRVYKDSNPANTSPSNLYSGYHLGAINVGTNSFLWKTRIGTPSNMNYFGYPEPNGFMIYNGIQNYAGSRVMVLGNLIITGNHDEGWNQGQSNKYSIFFHNGAVLGQFGDVYKVGDFSARAGQAGNALLPVLVKGATTDIAYLYHGDESAHGGVHQWKITGMDSVIELVNINIIYPSVAIIPPILPGRDLLQGFTFNNIFTSNTGYLTVPTTSGWTLKTNGLSEDRNDIDLLIYAESSSSSDIYPFLFDLGTNINVSSWKITSIINITGIGAEYTDVTAMKKSLDVLDNTGKIIVTITENFNSGTKVYTILVNGITLISGDIESIRLTYTSIYTNFSIIKSGSNIVVTLGDQSVTTSGFDSGVDITSPKTLRALITGGFLALGKSYDFKELRFITP